MSRLICATLLVATSLFAQIIEIKHIEEVDTYAKADSLIIFDIDNTLIEPAQDLGSSQWFYHRQSEYCREGVSATIALRSVLSEWKAIQNITDVVPVEEKTSSCVKALQKKYTVMALTTRGFDTMTCTLDQFRRVKIDMGKAAPISYDLFFKNGENVLFRRGILFTNGSEHGTALQHFFIESGFQPKHIVYVNDKASQLRLVERACEEEKIPFVGLRYGFLDEKVKNFNPEIAEMQREHFGRILSNEDVEKMLKAEATK